MPDTAPWCSHSTLWQRTDGLNLRDDALLRDSKQDAGRGESGLQAYLTNVRSTC